MKIIAKLNLGKPGIVRIVIVLEYTVLEEAEGITIFDEMQPINIIIPYKMVKCCYKIKLSYNNDISLSK
ncbi:MAG: hypothetical protein QG646_2436 [Euryarchaeota archaeon]|nr:hypothetical protein [Euryarchaeota archaeon]